MRSLADYLISKVGACEGRQDNIQTSDWTMETEIYEAGVMWFYLYVYIIGSVEFGSPKSTTEGACEGLDLDA